eukprot:6471044-Amphidinium_carterae.1
MNRAGFHPCAVSGAHRVFAVRSPPSLTPCLANAPARAVMTWQSNAIAKPQARGAIAAAKVDTGVAWATLVTLLEYECAEVTSLEYECAEVSIALQEYG